MDYGRDSLTGPGGRAVFGGVSRDRDAAPLVSKHLVLKSASVLPSELLPLLAAQTVHVPLTGDSGHKNKDMYLCVKECGRFLKISSLFKRLGSVKKSRMLRTPAFI